MTMASFKMAAVKSTIYLEVYYWTNMIFLNFTCSQGASAPDWSPVWISWWKQATHPDMFMGS